MNFSKSTVQKFCFRSCNEWVPFVISGFLSGIAATIFLYSLDTVTHLRQEHLFLILFLPLAGLAIGLIYYLYGKDISKGQHLILEEIHNPKKIISLRMAPMIYLGTLLTHLCGGSAGREGTAVQLGASLSDQISHFFGLTFEKRRKLLIAGTGSAFGAAIGAPWAGVFFGMEVIYVGKLQWSSFFECLLASFVAYSITKILNAPHTHFELLKIENYTVLSFFYLLIAALLFGLVARIFLNLSHLFEKIISKIKIFSPLKPAMIGIVIVFLYHIEGSFQYAGLGLETIQKYMHETADFKIPFLKMIFTILTVCSGFKGGEFVPLVFIGSTFGSALSLFLPLKLSLLANLGFVAVFAAASNTPLTCSIMAMELFGFSIAPYALVTCYLSYLISGNFSLYKNQFIIKSKKDQVNYIFSLLKFKKKIIK